MSKAEDPRRLELNASPPLRDALSALRGDGPSAAELGRMAERLGPLLDAEAIAPATTGGFTAKLVKLGLSLFALAAAVAWLILDGRTGESRPPAASHTPTRHPAAQHLPSQPGAGAGMSEKAVTKQPERPGEIAPAPAAAAARARPPAQRARKARAVHGAVVAAHGDAPSPEVLAAETAPAETAAPIEQARAPAVATGDVGGSRASAAPAVERAPAAPRAPAPREQQPLSEAALLHQARRIARGDPRRALALLDQHERRFASGMLVQERELLAVELLQALGRVEAARARLQAFRARFPDSIYLQRGAPHR